MVVIVYMIIGKLTDSFGHYLSAIYLVIITVNPHIAKPL